jgi:hypothetical protein
MQVKEGNQYKINNKVWNVFQVLDLGGDYKGSSIIRLDGWGDQPIGYLDVEFSQMIENGEVEEIT